MSLGIDTMANIRIQVLNSISNSLEVEDVLFIISSSNHKPNVQQALIPYTNLKSINDKYFARKQVVSIIEQRKLHPALLNANEAYFFSFDVTYNVDYCFYFDFIADTIQLHIYRKDGAIIFSAQNNPEFDERPYLFSEVISKDLIKQEPKSLIWGKIRELFHITHISNLSNILEKGLLSHTIAHTLKINRNDISNQLVQNRRKHVHSKVPLYFNILNPMTYTFSNQRDLVVLKVNKKVMLLPGTLYTDGNAAATATRYFTSLSDLQKIDWDCLNAKYWSNYPDGKRKRCAEVLIPHSISTKYITEIITYDFKHHEKINKMNLPHNILVTVDKNYFFEHD